MPSEPTRSHAHPWSETRATRRALAGIVTAGAVATLAACSSGTRREAEQGRERDSRRTSVVESMQQTATSSLVSGTPRATPTTEADD